MMGGRRDGNKHHRPPGWDGGSGGKWMDRIETSASLIVPGEPESAAAPGDAAGAQAGRPVRNAPLADVSGAPVTRGGLTRSPSGAHERRSRADLKALAHPSGVAPLTFRAGPTPAVPRPGTAAPAAGVRQTKER